MAGKCYVTVTVSVWLVVCVCVVVGRRPNVIFIMTDSMDGRSLDPLSAQYSLLNMPNLRNLAKQGVSFVRHYSNSPQCVPGRCAMYSGRHTHHTFALNNNFGFAMASDGVTLDTKCVSSYNADNCTRWGHMQGLNYTLYDAMSTIYGTDNAYWFGKMDVGANLIYQNNTQGLTYGAGYHEAPSLQVFTRSANIARPTKDNPKNMTNDNDNHVYTKDVKTINHCVDQVRKLAQKRDEYESKHGNDTAPPFFLHCSTSLPHVCV